jgi:hypothetical protein
MNQVLRRRLTAPGPTPLRGQPLVEDEIQDDGDDVPPDVVSVEDARLALVPSQSILPLLRDMSTLSSEVRALLRWTAVGMFFVKIILLILPCSPYVCSPTVLYPLLGLACVDLFL